MYGNRFINATYQSGSGTTSLVFQYTVTAGNGDMDGISLGNSINLNGGSIKGKNTGNDALLALHSVGTTISVLIDTTAPDQPALTGISSDTGISFTDHITKDTTLEIKGTAEANSTVEVFKSGVLLGTVIASAVGNLHLITREQLLPTGLMYLPQQLWMRRVM